MLFLLCKSRNRAHSESAPACRRGVVASVVWRSRLSGDQGGLVSSKNTRNFFTKAERRAQSDFKHDILESYLGSFAGKVGTRYPHKVGFIDGYAGPGESTNPITGSARDGSPRIALRVAAHHLGVNPARHLHSVFVEQKHEHFEALRRLVDAAKTPAWAFEGSIKDHLDTALEKIDGMPALVFLDPFGIGLDQVACVERILKRPGTQPTELLLNFSMDAVRRAGPFAKKPEGFKGREAMLETMGEWLGGDWWQEIVSADEINGEKNKPEVFSTEIARQYAAQVAAKAKCGVIAVPMQRSAAQQPIFTLMHFHPRAEAKFPYAEAVSYARGKWAERMWDLDIERAEREYERDPSIGRADVEMLRSLRDMSKKQDEADWVAAITANIDNALQIRDSLTMKEDFDVIFEGVVGYARGTHFRQAWDALAKREIVRKRDGTDYAKAVIQVARERIWHS
jgi:three-Cys-motif partner protein